LNLNISWCLSNWAYMDLSWKLCIINNPPARLSFVVDFIERNIYMLNHDIDTNLFELNLKYKQLHWQILNKKFRNKTFKKDIYRVLYRVFKISSIHSNFFFIFLYQISQEICCHWIAILIDNTEFFVISIISKLLLKIIKN